MKKYCPLTKEIAFARLDKRLSEDKCITIIQRLLIIMVLFFVGLSTHAKTTYIPTYRSYIHIVDGSDTISVSNKLSDIELSETSGLFTLRVEQEDVTQEKVRAIKRAKRAAGWATFSAVMSGVSTAFSDNSLQYLVRSSTMQLASELANIYSDNASAEEILNIYLWVDNTSEDELMVNDLQRGLVWYVAPKQSLRLKLNNPEASRLRFSNPKNDFVRYANVVVGSKVTKWDVAWENDEFWIVKVYNEGKITNDENILYYKRINKTDFEEVGMPVQTFRSFIKEQH